ncbi:DUF3828 domain-containing protein [Salmonella enterica]|nr:DUF3828 domain-containing protein [Salmonella enterica]
MMKKLLLLLLIATSAIADSSDPVSQAVAFNKWYVAQIDKNNFPITDGRVIDKYVTATTMQKLRRTQAPDYDGVFYSADFFLKAQDISEDWPGHVTAIAGDTDPICVNVYVAFGEKQSHIVSDCMVKEDGSWKVQSVTSLQFTRNL